eukprot:scaffold89652_cov58-Cyclotella_meneghiniana.AAC.2
MSEKGSIQHKQNIILLQISFGNPAAGNDSSLWSRGLAIEATKKETAHCHCVLMARLGRDGIGFGSEPGRSKDTRDLCLKDTKQMALGQFFREPGY